MKLNNKGFLITGILYSLLLLFLVLIIGMVAILSARQKKLDYISHDIITRLNDKYDFNIAKVWDFDYTGDYQTFTVPTDGYYQVELWGAQGGSITGTGYTYDGKNRGSLTYNGGNGAYTKGTIYLTKGENIYIYVGGTVSTNVSLASSGNNDAGGYNGGGTINGGQGKYGAPGGGATDVRLVSGSWDDFNSLKSRIMVAAGGGGANFRNQGYGEGNGGAGGSFYGVNGEEALTEGSYFRADYAPGYGIGTGGGQTYGGYYIQYNLNGTIEEIRTDETIGKFGRGPSGSQSGGGSGYYGGGSVGHGGAGGGSSFVSGLYGCDAILEKSTANAIVHTGQPNHYSGKVFYNGIMIAGNSDMPTHDGNDTMTGNTGNGYAKISLLSSSPQSYTATNLVANGSFEDGESGWIKRTETQTILEIDNSKSRSGNSSAKLTSPLDNNSIGLTSKYNAILNHVYYALAYVNPYNFEHNITIRIGYPSDSDTNGTKVWGAYMGNDPIGVTKSASFSRTSYLYTFNKQTAKFENDGTSFNMITIWNNTNKPTNVDEYFNVDDVLVIDLTETFGAGNEPSKEWCDENISYFDGTTTIYK